MTPDAPERYRLLVVDDDAVDRRAVRRALAAAGIAAEVDEAADAASARAAMRGDGYDCILLDVQLPGTDGLQVLSDARAEGVRTPVVVLTGHGSQEHAVSLMQAGASDYLSKANLQPDRLARALRHAVRVHHAEMAALRAEAEREAALTSRNRFYAAMSHELRTPVNAVLGYNDLLLAGVYGPLTPAQQEGLERSQRAARHLLHLVNDVLDLSKLEAGKVELVMEPVPVAELVHDLLVTVRPLAAEHRVPLRFAPPDDTCTDRLTTDPRRVQQILLNLLSNALKYGGGNPVEVRCTTGGGRVVLEVRDGGPGIAPEDLERIFEEFTQLPNANLGGTGLGLPISKRLATLLGGTLEAESEMGVGSVFRLVLPTEGTPTPAA